MSEQWYEHKNEAEEAKFEAMCDKSTSGIDGLSGYDLHKYLMNAPIKAAVDLEAIIEQACAERHSLRGKHTIEVYILEAIKWKVRNDN